MIEDSGEREYSDELSIAWCGCLTSESTLTVLVKVAIVRMQLLSDMHKNDLVVHVALQMLS